MSARPVLLVALVLAGCAASRPAVAPQRSGFEDMSPATQGMQRDDAANPGMLWVQEGRQLWTRAAGPQSRSCASCHGEPEKLRGVAARYPAFDEQMRRPINLAHRINVCRAQHQGQAPWPAEHQELLALEALVGLQSRGMPVAPSEDPRLDPYRQRGALLWGQRIGQLQLSCAQCHDERAGGRLAGTPIPQGQANGYPLYRLEWQSLGSLQRRVRNCMTGVRAEPLPYFGTAMAELELHLAARALGMPVETPAVRP